MIQETPQSDLFKNNWVSVAARDAEFSRRQVARHETLQLPRSRGDGLLYRKRQVKWSWDSSEGKECIRAIHSAGDIFGRAVSVRVERASGDGDRDETDER